MDDVMDELIRHIQYAEISYSKGESKKIYVIDQIKQRHILTPFNISLIESMIDTIIKIDHHEIHIHKTKKMRKIMRIVLNSNCFNNCRTTITR